MPKPTAEEDEEDEEEEEEDEEEEEPPAKTAQKSAPARDLLLCVWFYFKFFLTLFLFS